MVKVAMVKVILVEVTMVKVTMLKVTGQGHLCRSHQLNLEKERKIVTHRHFFVNDRGSQLNLEIVRSIFPVILLLWIWKLW